LADLADTVIAVTALSVPLSVLDLSPIPDGFTAADALRNSIDLVQHAERLGYTRYWVAEHHNHPGVACTSPPVLISHLASATTTIRVGAGGVMLPNHSSLVVAEQFGMLEGLHPGRIDLGLGRAPGTDQLTATALRRAPLTAKDDFPEQFNDLIGYFEGTLPPENPFHRVKATSAVGNMPKIWMLGSSDYGAHAAALLSLPYSFAHHFAADNTMLALSTYRSHFRPSDEMPSSYASIGVNVVCAPTDEEADWLAGSGRLATLRLRTGTPSAFPTPNDAAAYPYSPIEREQIRAWTAAHVVGSPTTVVNKLQALVDHTQVDELIITTMLHSHDLRVRSFELLAEAVDLSATSTRAAA
jgi:luciferase family oxidoreductase group 1